MRPMTLALLLWPALLGQAVAEEKLPSIPGKPEVLKLGDDKYQIGNIVINREEKEFSVPGKILRLEPPIEFLAVTTNGFKAYESFLELQADAIEFNLACILIGINEKTGKPPKFHFDPEPLQGDSVELLLSWEADGKTMRVSMAEIFKPAGQEAAANDWVYTGSRFYAGQYMAAQSGTLVGLIHDPDSIIEHRAGFGQASYGNLKPDAKLLPSLQTPIRLVVKRKS